ncbi:hypothetical protein [Phenylobacterium sp.]|uniref:hypothetical protein n=1 Tax=Phenylobacterium sp. TaxID=1871053 RepID=UPI0035B42DC0
MLSKFFKSKTARPGTGQTAAPVDDPVQMIGQGTIEAAHDPDGKIVLYAEVEDGVISADIFSRAQDKSVRFRFAPEPLRNLIYSYWEAEHDLKRRWATMTMVIEAGRFNMDFEYPDALARDEALHERRPRVVRRHFGEEEVDYSSPR